VVQIYAVGLKALATQFKALPSALNRSLGERMSNFARDTIMEESLLRCPKKTGALRSTGRVRRTKTTPNEIRIRLSYGGRTPGSSKHFVQGAKIKPVVEYAHALHENTYKTYSEPNTGPKYLEDPIKNNKADMARVIRSGVQEATMSVFSGAFKPTKWGKGATPSLSTYGQ
jgi:hypothetical protein